MTKRSFRNILLLITLGICILVVIFLSRVISNRLRPPLSMPLPSFILAVYPSEGSVVSQGEFPDFVGADLVPFYAGISLDGPELWIYLKEKTSLYLNGNLIDQDYLSITMPVSGQSVEIPDTNNMLEFWWHFELLVGEYEAELRVEDLAGEILVYKWRFQVIE